MKVGDRVDIHYRNGVVQQGRIAGIQADTVVVRQDGDPDAGAIIVPARRLRPQGPDRWRLDL